MSNLSSPLHPDPQQSPRTMEPGSGNLSLAVSPIFVGVVLTQFLGAFNDNYFKQMLLLKCVEFEHVTQESSERIDL